MSKMQARTAGKLVTCVSFADYRIRMLTLMPPLIVVCRCTCSRTHSGLRGAMRTECQTLVPIDGRAELGFSRKA